jgi:hypothetical protein
MSNVTPERDPTVDYLVEVVNRRVGRQAKWYRSRTTWPRILFRLSGMLVIVGSLSLPVLAASSVRGRDELLGIISLVVASLTSLGAFFRWDSTWRSRARTAQTLEGLIARWELRLMAYELGSLNREEFLRSTEELVEESYRIVGAETDQFFSAVKFPESATPAATPD